MNSEVEFNTKLKAPFPYFGGKGKIASVVWDYLGDVKRYIEPFFGSGAVLLKRPGTSHKKSYEIVCDKDGFIANVWRAIQFDPNEVAKWCDWPVNHADLVSRKKELIKNESMLLENLCNDGEWYDAKLAGYWAWCASCWIGSGMTRPGAIPALTGDIGIHSKMPRLTNDSGIHSQIPQIDSCKKELEPSTNAHRWLRALSQRLRYVKVVCGDWSRVCGGNWQDDNKPVGMFFDPPYATSVRNSKIYHHDSLEIGKDVEKWVLPRGDNPNYRIVVCGYDSEYQSLVDNNWFVHKWSAMGGYGNKSKKKKNKNRHLERLFISPYCVKKNETFEDILKGVEK